MSGDARRAVNAWWRERLSDDGPVDFKVEARRAAAELREDPAFVAAFLDDYLVRTIKDVGERINNDIRKSFRSRDVLRAQIDEDIQRLGATWAAWREWVPARGCSVPLPLMTREDVLSSAQNYTMLARTNGREAHFLHNVAAKLQPGQRVDEVFTEEQIIALRRKLGIEKDQTS